MIEPADPIKDRQKLLSGGQIEELNKKGHSLKSGKFYLLRFIFNNKKNKAWDPVSYRIHESITDKLAKSAIGMPFVVPPYGIQEHLRGPHHGLPDTTEALLEVQKKYTIGEIVDYIKYDSGNVFGIIEVWPKFIGAVENDLIPPLVSPTINIKEHDDNWDVLDAEFLNLQAVPSSGYPANLTEIKGMCTGGIKECMKELRPAGAAGPDSFSNTNSNPPKSMSEQTQELTLENVNAKVEQQGQALAELSTKVEGVAGDIASIKEKLDGKSDTGDNPESTGDAPAGAQGPYQQQVVTLKKELESLNKKFETYQSENDAERKVQAEKTRKLEAGSIVDALIAMKRVDSKNRETEAKKYYDLKGDDGQPLDLTALANTLKTIAPASDSTDSPAGAFGPYTSGVPEFRRTGEGKHSTVAELSNIKSGGKRVW